MKIKRKQIRQKELALRKSFLPTVIFTSLLWTTVGFIVCLMDPESFGALPAFLVAAFGALTFTFALMLANTRRGIIAASTITAFLILRYFGVGNILNLLLLAALAVTTEIYFHNK